jgi:subtilisin family serine protease
LACAPVHWTALRRIAFALLLVLGSLAFLAGGATARPDLAAGSDLVEVVVTLPQPSLSEATLHDRGLASARTAHRKLDLRAPAAVSYLRTLASAQRALQSRIQAAIPEARARWHYSVVLNGMAVVVPRSQLGRLKAIRGATVWPSVTYHSLLDRSPQLIGAPAVWGPTLATAGEGIKIGIIDDGLDSTHVFFDPSGFTYPAGFPKGQAGYTTAKVIVARAFAPATPTWKYANVPFDPQYSDHATNVSGIAAGDANTTAIVQGTRYTVSGIAPKAYLGNYKVLSVPTDSFGLDGNSPEITAGIEQAVSDGMDVINLSLGEPEVEPTRDIVVKAIDDAADAGVVPVIAAGNDFTDAGRGSVGSPGTASKAITVAASSDGNGQAVDEIADFSSSGPTPISLEMKPDVTAPGLNILSSLPRNTWSAHDWSGTSMASPHVAGAAAVLKQRHPTWTVEQIKSALESTGDPVHPAGAKTEISAAREGGGRIDLPRADTPLVFTDPTGLSFGLVRRGTTTTRALATADAGGGSAPWTVAIAQQSTVAGTAVSASLATVAAGTSVNVSLATTKTAAEGEATGFVTLTRGTDVRRVPYWFRVEVPRLASEPVKTIAGAGTFHGDTAGKKSLVSTYRYPEAAPGIALSLTGPEQVFELKLKRPVANVGAVITGRAGGVSVVPRMVVGRDENRLTGYAALPVDLNPYADFGRPVSTVAAILPSAGTYDFVFDTPAGRKPGAFTFHVWVNDVTPPTVKLLTPSVPGGATIKLGVTDAGSGVDPKSIVLKVDDGAHSVTFSRGVASVSSAGLSAGRHKLVLTAADYEETKNMEDVGPILPNTRRFTAFVVVR